MANPYSVSLNGTSSYVQSSTFSTAVASISMGAWFYSTAATQQRQCVIYNGAASANGYGIYFNRDNTTYGLYVLDGGVAWTSSLATPSANAWHHVVMTIDATGAIRTVYLDGTSLGTTSTAPHTPTNATQISNDWNSSGFFNGQIDEAFFYNGRVLTAAEVAAIYAGSTLPSSSLYFYYKFDEGSGTTATDSSGNSNTGTITSGTYSTNTAPVFSSSTPYSLLFNGTNNYVTVPDASGLNVTTDFTMACWIKPTTLQSSRQFEKHVCFGFQSSGNMRSTIPGVVDIDDTGSTLIQAGVWQHIAVTHTGTSYVFYINGAVNSTITNANNPGTGASTLYLGGSNLNSALTTNGLVDDQRIYSRSLSGTEIATLASGGNPSATGLQGWWKYDEGSGTTATDSSGSTNPGTLTYQGTPTNPPTYSTDVPAVFQTIPSHNLSMMGVGA